MKKPPAAPRQRRHARRAQAPVRVGRYRLIELLGVGGMAEVFKATCSGPGGFERTVVVKRILPARSQDPQFVGMFVAEAKILGMLHHPNVVKAFDFGEENGALFLVLEYVDGPSLLRTIRALRAARRTMPVAIAAHFANEICRALDYIHNLAGSDGEPLRVVHRDVTPSNVVLTSAGGLKLLDFGVARYSTSAAPSDHGMLKGKAAYLAPEALNGGPIDGRLDIFSLGVMLHEMLTLTDLFQADSHLTTLHKVLAGEIVPPSRLRPEVPPELDAIVMKALERDPSRRYAHAADMARELNELVVGARLQVDQVIELVREVQAELAKARGGVPLDPRPRTEPTTPEGPATERDLGLRFRMSRLGRFLSGRRGDEPR